MAATGEEEMESLISSFDQIYEDAVNGAQEIQLLKSRYHSEISKRKALEITSCNLQSENERLTKLYMGFTSRLCDQFEYRSKYESLEEQLKRVNDECLKKIEEEHNAAKLIEKGYIERIGDLEAQLRSLTIQKTENEETIECLNKDLATHKSQINGLVNKMETLHRILESKYHQEVQDLKDCLMIEQEEKYELNKKLQDLERELLYSRTKMDAQQRDLSSSRHVESLKEKIMKLRKENEVLKRKCKVIEEG